VGRNVFSLPQSFANDDQATNGGDDRAGEAAVRDNDDTTHDEE
jgi:hypothetical protein